MKDFVKILELARENVRRNPSISEGVTKEVALRYLDGLKDEVEEVREEIKEGNEVYLTDELCDIAWDYSTLMAILEERGWIESADRVLEHGAKKYSERAPAFLEHDSGLWNTVKAKQKEELKKKHQEKYGS